MMGCCGGQNSDVRECGPEEWWGRARGNGQPNWVGISGVAAVPRPWALLPAYYVLFHYQHLPGLPDQLRYSAFAQKWQRNVSTVCLSILEISLTFIYPPGPSMHLTIWRALARSRLLAHSALYLVGFEHLLISAIASLLSPVSSRCICKHLGSTDSRWQWNYFGTLSRKKTNVF